MLPFPLTFMTWRESIVGFQPAEMVYMQVEKNWVNFTRPGFNGMATGYAGGENLGSVKWRMSEATVASRKCRMLHSESRELLSGILQIEEVWVDPATNEIVQQNEQRTTVAGNERSEAIFFPDRIELKRTALNGRVSESTMYPDGGMAAVQRRFAPMGKDVKEFLFVEGLKGAFRKLKIEPTGRFHGSWATEKYEGQTYRFTGDGKDQVVLLTDEGEVVQVKFMKNITLALTAATKSRRNVPQPTGGSRR